MRAQAPEPCPCGRTDASRRPVAFGACCGRWLGAEASAAVPDAESLMRSRYTAFVRGDAGHLLATWHPATRPATLELDATVRWLGLDVRRHLTLDERHAEVEFVARSRSGGRAHRLHERSRFVREDGRWYYVDGDIAP